MGKANSVPFSTALITILALTQLVPSSKAFFIHSPTQGESQLVKIGVVTPDENEAIWALVRMAENDINDYMRDNAIAFRFEFLFDHGHGEWSIHLDKIYAFKVQQNIDLIIGGAWSSMATLALNYINENDMLLLSPSATSPQLAIPDDNFFRLAPPSNLQAQAIAELLQSFGVNAVVVIQEDRASPIFEALEDDYSDVGGAILDRIIYPQGETDFSSYLALAEETAVEAVVQYGRDQLAIQIISYEGVEKIAKQAVDYPTIYDLRWFGIDSTATNEDVLREAAEEADHLKIYSTKMAELNSPKFNDLKDRLEQEVNGHLNFHAANWYDAAWVYALSVVAAGSADAMDVKEELPGVAAAYEGVTGWCTLNEAGDRYLRYYDIWCYGYERGEPSFIKCGEITIPIITSISCGTLPSTLNIGWSLTISGYITPSITDLDVTLEYTRPDGSILSRAVETDENGTYANLFTPDKTGMWRVKASLVGDSEYKASVSPTQYFTVNKNPTSLSIEISKRRITEGSPIMVSGAMTGVSNVIVTVSFTMSDGATLMKTVNTGLDGSYNISYKPMNAGIWFVKSSWGGNASHSSAASSTLEFTVVPLTGDLEIVVEDKDGNPLSGAVVSSELQPLNQGVLTGSSSTDGIVVFTGIRVGGYTIQASKAGYYPESGSVSLALNETKNLKFTLNEKVGNLEIVVEDSKGNIVPEAMVSFTSEPSEQSFLSGTTGLDGSVTFKDLKLGSYTFEASKKGHISASGSASVEAGETTAITISLERESSMLERIPGFPYESVLFGLVLGVSIIWMLHRRARLPSPHPNRSDELIVYVQKRDTPVCSGV